MTDDDDALRDRLLSLVDESAPQISADQILARTPIARHAHVRNRRIRVRTKLRRRLLWTSIIFSTVLLVLVGAVFIDASVLNGEIKRITVRNLAKPPTKGPEQGTENILLVGSTSRCAASSIPVYSQQCDEGVDGVNSDVVLIAHLDGNTGQISLLSIPRDDFVPGARSGSALCGTSSPLTPGTCANKIDSALVEGPDQLVAAVERDFGIPINHYIDLNFATFTDVVNALGDMKMDFPDAVFDASSGLKITRAGCQTLNGAQALALVRSRHLYYFTAGETPDYAAIQAANDSGVYYTPDSGGTYDGTGDLGRIVRVHLFLKALAEQVASRGLGNPIADQDLVSAVAPNLTVDQDLSALDMFHLALAFRDANFGAAPELTLPTVTYGETYYYEGGNYGDVIFPDAPADQRVIDEFLGIGPPGKNVAPASVSVSVVDGTGSPEATATVESSLSELGYRVVPTTVTDDVGPVAETTVLYEPGHLVQAQRVLSSLSGMAVLGGGVPPGGADVAIIAGTDLAVQAPSKPSAPSSTSASAPASTPTTSPLPAALASNPNFSYNPPTGPIPSYDPRSC
jgi:LCP family protein required for cell wall assembly